MVQDLLIRTYREGDEYAIFHLTNIVYSKTGNLQNWLKYWKWKFIHTSERPTNIWVAEYENKIVGHIAYIPLRMVYQNKKIIGCQAVDLIIHPDYRRKGIFIAMGRKALDTAGERGITIAFGFGTKEARMGHLKYGWFDVCSLPRLFKPLRLETVLQKRIQNRLLLKISSAVLTPYIKRRFQTKKIPSVQGAMIKKISSFDERFDDFWKKTHLSLGICVVRDSKYLNWRYIKAPHQKYVVFSAERGNEALGFIVVRVREGVFKSGEIVDILTLPCIKEVANNLILKAINYLEKEKVCGVHCWLLGNESYYNVLRKCGFIPLRHTQKFIARANSQEVNREFLKRKENWFITMGDSDRH